MGDRSGRISEKAPFDIDVVMRRVEEAVQPFPKAAMFELADAGYSSPFEQLISCIISIRTYDEVTTPTARKLFERARTPQQIGDLSEDEIDQLISSCTFHESKAKQIRDIALKVTAEHFGILPCDVETMLSFRGVGVKCANLTLGIACGEPRISVDIHVHRVTNRWGYVKAPTPEKTLIELENILPERYWVDINRFLVPFGKHICTGNLPKCSSCPVLDMCRQAGVKAHL